MTLKEKLSFLAPDKELFNAILFYGLSIGFLSLAVPVSVQALVNAVSFGVVLQPIVIISLVLLTVLVFFCIVKILQEYTAELVERRVFIRLTDKLSKLLTQYDVNSFEKYNQLDFLNRFFEITTLQKSLTSLIVDGVSVFLQVLVGLIIIAFYHPYFLIFDFLLILVVILVFRFYGKKAQDENYDKSTEKYNVAAWIETISRRSLYFRSSAGKKFVEQKTYNVLNKYVSSTRLYFRTYLIIVISSLAIYALATSFLLGVGGWLVTKEELSLGQLVAAELMLTLILGGLLKVGKICDAYFSMISALKKIHYFEEVTLEQNLQEIANIEPIQELTFDHVRFRDSIDEYALNFAFQKGKIYSISTKSASSKRIFKRLITKQVDPIQGQVRWNSQKFIYFNHSQMRDLVAIADDRYFFNGTVIENLICLNPGINFAELTDILDGCDLKGVIDNLPMGLNTAISENGYPFSISQAFRLNLASQITCSKEIIVLDDWMDHLEDDRKVKIVSYLKNKFPHSIIIVFAKLNDELSHDKLVLSKKGIEHE